jgi:trypsin-like peptidase
MAPGFLKLFLWTGRVIRGAALDQSFRMLRIEGTAVEAKVFDLMLEKLPELRTWRSNVPQAVSSVASGGRLREVTLVLAATLICNGCATVGKEALRPAETVILSTYPLASSKAFGTGFLMAMKDRRAPGGVVPVMVTSTHLVKTAGRGAIYMPLRGFDAHGNLSAAVVEVVPARKGLPFYVRHPVFDVAAFRVRFPQRMPVPLLLTLLEEKNLESQAEPRAGEEVVFVGFPEGQGTSLGMFPVLRAGRIASLDQSLLGLRSFLINGDVYPGDSGAPVFRASQSGKPSLVGMVTERLGFGRKSPFPLALAVDARAIRETLHLLSESER